MLTIQKNCKVCRQKFKSQFIAETELLDFFVLIGLVGKYAELLPQSAANTKLGQIIWKKNSILKADPKRTEKSQKLKTGSWLWRKTSFLKQTLKTFPVEKSWHAIYQLKGKVQKYYGGP